MSTRSFQNWYKLAFKLLVSLEWEKVYEKIEDGDNTYRWVKEQILVSLNKIERDAFRQWIGDAASSLRDRLISLKSPTPDEDSYSEIAFWLKNLRGKGVLYDPRESVEHRVIGAKLALLEASFVHYDDHSEAGRLFCGIIDKLYDIDAIEEAIDGKKDPALATKVKVIYDCAKEYAEPMGLLLDDWTDITFDPDGLMAEAPPPYQPPDIWVFGDFGRQDGQLYYPDMIHIDAEDNFVVMDQNVIGENTVQRIQLFSPKGKFIKILLKRGAGKVNGMRDFCLNMDGNLVVCDTDEDEKGRIQLFDYDANQLLSFSIDRDSPDSHPRFIGVFVDTDGQIFGADIDALCIQVFSPDGKLKLKFGQWGRKDGEFLGMSSVCVEAGKIYAIDGQARKTQVFDGSGNFVSQFGSRLAPKQLLFDTANNQIYGVDHGNHKIQVYGLDGSIKKETEGGFGTALEEFWFPSSIALMADGRLAVAERENHRIKVFQF